MTIKTVRSLDGKLLALRNPMYVTPKIPSDFFAGNYLILNFGNEVKLFFVILLHSAN